MVDCERPLVSVVVPTRDRCALLADLLASLERQTYRRRCYEVVVVDDGSQDGTAEMLRGWSRGEPGRRALTRPRQGAYAARNAGVAAARGLVIAFTDDDCRVAPDWLQRIVEAFARHPAALGVQGRTETAQELVTPFTHQIVVRRPNSLFETCNMAYRRQAVLEAGAFDEALSCGLPITQFGDTQLGAAVSSRGPVVFDPAVLVVHPPRARVFRDRATWRTVLGSEWRYHRRQPDHYRRHRGRSFVLGVIAHWLLGSTVKQLAQHRGWIVRQPALYGRFALRLAWERVLLAVALLEFLARRRHHV